MQSPMKTYYILLQLICSARCCLLLNQHVYTDEIQMNLRANWGKIAFRCICDQITDIQQKKIMKTGKIKCFRQFRDNMALICYCVYRI